LAHPVADAIGLTSGKPSPGPVDGESFCRGEGVAIVLMDWAINAWRLGVLRLFLSVEGEGVIVHHNRRLIEL